MTNIQYWFYELFPNNWKQLFCSHDWKYMFHKSIKQSNDKELLLNICTKCDKIKRRVVVKQKKGVCI